MDKIKETVKAILDFLTINVGEDRMLHLFVAAYIVAFASVFYNFFWWLPVVTWLAVSLLAFAKEMFIDEAFDAKDLLATFFGGGLALFLLALFTWFTDSPWGGSF